MSYVIDQVNCSGCHRCRVECPAEAITFKNDKYWIDEEKCVDCGHCATVCHNECVSSPENPAPAPTPHEKTVLSCDVAVVGGGGAGMACAARAAENGAKVIVLEKGKEVGGSADYAHQIKVLYSRFQERLGMPDDRDALYKKFIEKTEGKVNPKLVRNIFDANTELFNWLIDDHDMDKDFHFAKGGMMGQLGLVSSYVEEYNAKRIDTMIGPGGHGWWMCRKLLGILLDNGGQVLYHTAGTKLLTDKDGSVTGVLAKDDGGEVEIHCKAVVVTAGAFTRNREIMDKMQPMFYGKEGDDPIHVFTCSRCTGDGLTMCGEIGADIDYVNRRVNMFGPMRHPYPAVSLNAFGRDLQINAVGEVYESPMAFTEVSPLAYQPKRYCWSIVDGKTLKSNIEGAMNSKYKDCVNIDLDKFLAKWPEVIAEEEAAGSIVSAPTIEALAEKLGFDKAKFAAIIADNNEKAAAPMAPPPFGAEPPAGDFDFASLFDGDSDMPMMPQSKKAIKDGPFYAIKLKLFHENSMGGMTIDEHTSVLRGGQPIAGLYAAGDNTRGIMLPGDIGVGFIENTISALTFALTSGYLAGKEASSFALSK